MQRRTSAKELIRANLPLSVIAYPAAITALNPPSDLIICAIALKDLADAAMRVDKTAFRGVD